MFMRFIVLLIVGCSLFLPNLSAQNLVQLEYCIDEFLKDGDGIAIDLSPGESLDDVFQVDVSSLEPGQHMLYFRVLNEHGEWSLPVTKSFYVSNASDDIDVCEVEYTIDEHLKEGEGDNHMLEQGQSAIDVQFNLDIAALEPGHHNLFVRAKDETGKWSLPVKSSFYLADMSAPAGIVKYEFSLDAAGKPGEGYQVTLNEARTYHDTLLKFNIADLSDGIHQFYLRTMNEQGIWSMASSGTFYKAAPDTVKVKEIYYRVFNEEYEGEWLQNSVKRHSALVDTVLGIQVGELNLEESYSMEFYAENTMGERSNSSFLENVTMRRNSSPEKLKEEIALTLTTGDEFRIAMDTIFDDVDLEYGDTLAYAHQSASTPSLEDFLSWEDETNLLLNPISGYEGEYSFELVATDKFDEQELIPVILDVNMPTAVEHYRENTISLYPNPVKEKLMVEAPFEQKVLSVNLFNLQGELKYQWTGKLKHLSLDVRSLNAGTYMIAIYTTNGVVKRKIIIQ